MELIKIKEDNGKQVVSARDLYNGLGLNLTQWKRWYQKNIEKNIYAEENVDWVGFDIMSNGNETKDFALSLDFAKRLAMTVRTEKGEEVRRYFLDCEKKLKEAPKEEVKQIAKLEDSVFFVNAFADAFRISESSKLRMFDELKGNYHIPTSLPAYAVDKSLGSVVDSAEVAVSLTELLKKHEVGISANKAYPILQSYGIVERKARKSTSGYDKKFWSITDKGLAYGKNVVSMHNPKETQVLFFESKFEGVLVMLLGTLLMVN